MATKQELLDSVNAAIAAISDSGGTVEMDMNGRRVKKDLPGLQALRKELQTEISAASGASMRTHIFFMRPR